MKRTFKELRPGDVMLTPPHIGIVIEIDIEGSNPFWSGKPNIEYVDLEDPYYGTLCCEIDPDAEIEVEGKSPVGYYKKAIEQMSRYVSDMMALQLKMLGLLYR